ncbi:cytochrome-c peroxidase [Hymenobacter wooponensis]|uniref:Uncharacterized protein n=1 Tax=Hymenobacter wooponensis TaxID=1525360 RepID=A0A4Z0ME53_9BACT|nr:hypothetical protein [Hymenobacter wooponensis]TGD77640.1 hypothetical protein EU557_22970 [Hymenobacter wooponensis]
MGKALTSFERPLVTADAPYDDDLKGNTSALTAQQVQGLTAAVAAGCARGHSGPMFSDYQAHVLGLPNSPKLAADPGINDTKGFRTPSLRNVALTAPYMHNGVLATLQAVLNFYDQGGATGARRSTRTWPRVSWPQLPGRVQNTGAILAFLQALSAKSYARTIPASVPSGLPVGGNLK